MKRTAATISEMGVANDLFAPQQLKIDKTFKNYEGVIKKFCLFLEQTEDDELLNNPVELLDKGYLTDLNIALSIESEG